MSNERKAVELTHDGHPVYISNLGIPSMLALIYMATLSDLEECRLKLPKGSRLTVMDT